MKRALIALVFGCLMSGVAAISASAYAEPSPPVAMQAG